MAGKIRLTKRSVQSKTTELRHQDIKKNWVLIDAEGVILGRLAAEVSKILRGKHRPNYTPSVDCGDHVIIINGEKVRMTGNKAKDSIFYYHTGHPGGIKERTRDKLLKGKRPGFVIEKAVERMMPRGPLARRQLGHLRVYKGAEHPHAAQNPTVLDLAARNPKNKRAE